MILDLQGSMYQLYDPEIAMCELEDDSDSCEFYFCAGYIDKFKEEHVCNTFWKMLNILEAESTCLDWPNNIKIHGMDLSTYICSLS